MPRTLWLKAALVLLAIWLVAGGAIFWARSVKVTPESLAAYVEAHPLTEGSADRTQILERVADQLNQLSYEQRREFRMGRKLDGFFRSLTPAEQGSFLDRTLPTGFKQMMESLNKMQPEQRKRFVERALRDMREKEGENDANLDQNARKMIDQGFKSFYNDASLETKMDVAPLVEQIQKNLQGLR